MRRYRTRKVKVVEQNREPRYAPAEEGEGEERALLAGLRGWPVYPLGLSTLRWRDRGNTNFGNSSKFIRRRKSPEVLRRRKKGEVLVGRSQG
jgi:hypothetical protein